jgi:hypothetical protein
MKQRSIVSQITFLLLLSGCFSAEITTATSSEKDGPNASFKVTMESNLEFTNKTNVNLNLEYSSSITHFAIENSEANCLASSTWKNIASVENVSITNLQASNTYWLKAKDKNNQETNCTSISITHDSQKPSLPINFSSAQPSSGLSLTESLAINWSSFNDNGPSGIEKYEARVLQAHDNIVVKDWQTIQSADSISDLSLFPDIMYKLEVRALDKAGNYSPIVKSPHWSNNFSFKESFVSTRGLHSPVKVDFDKDGDDDVVYIRGGIPSTIVLFTNQGDGNLVASELYSTVATIWHLDIIDYDADGHEDFVLTTSEGTSILVQKDNGSYNEIVVSSTSHDDLIAMGDFNNDSLLDIIALDDNPDKISLYLNTGGNSFSYSIVTPAYNGGKDIEVVDLDKDGNLDFLVPYYSANKIVWFKNDGTGNFTHIEILNSLNFLRKITAVDLDKDLDIDIVLTDGGSADVYWLENDGSQNFSLNAIGSGVSYTNKPKVVDIDKDLDLDIIAGSLDGQTIDIFYNNGSQVFTKVSKPVSITSSYRTLLDLDGDTHLDLFGANLTGVTSTYLNDTSQNLTLFSNTHSFSKTFYRDFDGDTDIDILGFDSGDKRFYLARNDGTGNYSSYTAVSTALTATPLTIEVFDMEPDGDFDIGYSIYSGGSIVWLENDGTGSFTSRILRSGLSFLRYAHFGDVDKDNDIDIMYSTNSNLILGTNNGSETFANSTLGSSIGQSYSIKLSDIDKDNDNDIVLSISASNSILCYQNDGSQNFTQIEIVPSAGSNLYAPGEILIDDFNSDTHLDIVVQGRYNGEIWQVMNDGTNSYLTPRYLASSDSSSFLKSLDIDNDGDKDVVVNSLDNNSVKAFKNVGLSSLLPSNIIQLQSGLQDIDILDFDGDGTPEIVFTVPSEKAFILVEF